MDKAPTHKNITEAFRRLAEMSQPGDAVFVLFTGHGCRIMDSPIDVTAESYDEALLPSDFEESGIIRDTLVFKTLFAPMKKGVTLTCIIDCAHTGVMIDLPYLWSTKENKDNKKEEQQANVSPSGSVLLPLVLIVIFCFLTRHFLFYSNGRCPSTTTLVS
jgi:hypothetical protein